MKIAIRSGNDAEFCIKKSCSGAIDNIRAADPVRRQANRDYYESSR
jgi:hypothetical protein